jgi:glycosyltransferase involved in cell wall biosynthesis
MKRRDKKGLIFLPAWNESQTISSVLLEILALNFDFDLIVVDDGSTDETAELANMMQVLVLKLPINVGVGGAIKCAMRYAWENGYDYLFQVDADGQHNPLYIRHLHKSLLNGSDVVVGSRFGPGNSYRLSFLRKLIIRVLSILIYRITHVVLTDPTSGFRGFSRQAIEALKDDFPTEYLGDTIECLILSHHARLKISEISVEMRERQGGEPSSGLFASFGYLLRALLAIFASEMRHASSNKNLS